jgi:hypothetical protein
VELNATFRGVHQTITLGYVAANSSESPVRLYRAQTTSMKAALKRLSTAAKTASGSQRRRLRDAAADVRSLLKALQARKPLVTTQTGYFRAGDLRRAQVNGSLRSISLISGKRPVRPPKAKAANAPAQENYMPRQWDADTQLVNDLIDGTELPATGDLHEKRTWVGLVWDSQASLDWYEGDDHGMRGIEIEGFPSESSPIWSTDWSIGLGGVGTSWASNLPNAYRDDLSSDGARKNFAIGSGDGKSLEYNVYYWAQYQTNAGESDTGTVHLNGQAVRRATTAEYPNWGYCLVHGGNDDPACFFGETGTAVSDYSSNTPGEYAIGGGGYWEQYPYAEIPPPYELFYNACGGLRLEPDGSNVVAKPSGVAAVSPDGHSVLRMRYDMPNYSNPRLAQFSRDGYLERDHVYNLPLHASLQSVAYDPSGDAAWLSMYFNSDEDTSDIYKLDLSTGTTANTIYWPGDQSMASVSPDGRYLAFYSDVRADGTRPWGSIPDGDWRDGELHMFDLQTQTDEILKFMIPETNAYDLDKYIAGGTTKPVFSPDGSKVAYVAFQDGNNPLGSIHVQYAHNVLGASDALHLHNEYANEGEFARGVAWADNERIVYSRDQGVEAVSLEPGDDQGKDHATVLDHSSIGCTQGGDIEARAASTP